MWRERLRASSIPASIGAVIVGSLALSLAGASSAGQPVSGPSLPAPVDTPPAPAEQGGLFSSDGLIEFVLEANWDELDDDRDQESPERPGRVLWRSPDDQEVAIPIQVRTRGIFRLMRSTCSLPPIRLNFPSEGSEGTVFHGQDKLKLVTHCRDRDAYEQNVLEEYLAYRIYNLLTDISFRVRLAKITYVDSRGEDDPVTRTAFLIEEGDSLAARLGGMMLEVESAPASSFQQEQAALMYLFQFLIGNTDWSMTRFHNVEVVRIGGDHLPIPYDFDWSGLVDAPYAGPNPLIAHLIDNVRQRLYWGECNEAIDYQAQFARFNEKRDTILKLAQSIPELTERNRQTAVRYLEGFYGIINNEGAARRQIVNACRR